MIVIVNWKEDINKMSEKETRGDTNSRFTPYRHPGTGLQCPACKYKYMPNKEGDIYECPKCKKEFKMIMVIPIK